MQNWTDEMIASFASVAATTPLHICLYSLAM